uniref:Uncharacterized protein n=1 Tax=Anguilla anguilla TaxID=7936 RepID=A0A0E9VHX6_ANGAN
MFNLSSHMDIPCYIHEELGGL